MQTIEAFSARTGELLGRSGWFAIDQARIDAFAEVTEDRQFIHVDPARAAAETPLGGSIAHGFLTLSLLSHLGQQVFPEIAGKVMTFNYGLNRVRFLAPVPAGARVRVAIRLLEVVEKGAGRHLCRFESTVEIEGRETPALVAEQLLLHVIDSDADGGADAG